MIYEIKMPSLGADMDSGKFIEWKVKTGDHVSKDQTLAVIETSKAEVDIDSFRSGKIVEIVAVPEKIYPVGAVLAKLELDQPEVLPSVPPVSPVREPPLGAERMRVTPAARRLAQDKGIELQKISGSGPEGTIQLEDVQKVVGGEALPDVRTLIAKTMSRSKKEIPHYYLRSRIRMDALVAAVDQINKARPVEERIFIPAALMFLLAKALQKHPELNGYYQNGRFQPSSQINMGMVISLKSGGIVVPAVMNIQERDVFSVNNALKDLIQRSREGKLKAPEIAEGTITVTNVGDLGSDEVFGIIFPPQVALIGLGTLHKEAVVESNLVKAGFVIDVTLSADHRVSDGLAGSGFLRTVCSLIESAELATQ